MEQKELEKIIRQVVEEIVNAAPAPCPAAACGGKKKALIVGDIGKVPAKLRAGAELCPLSEYEGCRDISGYDTLIITELTLLQLADIALGRPSDVACCAVISALLEGKEAALLESALPHRRFAGKASPGLYGKLEGYVRTLEGFGVKLMTPQRLNTWEEIPAKPAKFAAPPAAAVTGSARPNRSRLITEDAALKMTADAPEELILPRDAILTPSARDVFIRRKVTLKYED